MGSTGSVQRFNPARGWRLVLVIAVLIVGASVLSLVLTRQYPSAMRPWAFAFISVFWGLSMAFLMLGQAREFTVGRGWVEVRSWRRSLLGRIGSYHDLTGHQVVRSVSGTLSVEPDRDHRGQWGIDHWFTLGRLNASDWATLSASLRSEGIAIVDKQGAWEARFPGRNHARTWLMRLAALGFVAGIGGFGVFALTFGESGLVTAGFDVATLGLATVFWGLGVALCAGIAAWWLTRIPATPSEPAGGPEQPPARP